MKIEVISYLQENTRTSYQKPKEDFVLISSNKRCAAVADGVTRMRINGIYPDLSTQIAAECLCRSMIGSYERGERRMNVIHEEANRRIAYLNAAYSITEESELLECVGAMGYFEDKHQNIFYYGYLGDSGILVYDRELYPVFMTQNNLEVLEFFRDRSGLDEPTCEYEWRTKLRNKPGSRRMTRGGLSGEPDAIEYVRTGTVLLEGGDTILLFTDGILPFVYERAFRSLVQICLSERVDYGSKVTQYIASHIPALADKGIKNLDDDKAFIAFSYDE